jgi:hypothetical protein
MSAGNSRAAHMSRGKRSGYKKIIVIMYPNEQSYMPNDSMNIEKNIKIYLLSTCIITENAKLREKKKHKHLHQLTSHQLQLYYNYNQANEYFQKNFIGNPFGYACWW